MAENCLPCNQSAAKTRVTRRININRYAIGLAKYAKTVLIFYWNRNWNMQWWKFLHMWKSHTFESKGLTKFESKRPTLAAVKHNLIRPSESPHWVRYILHLERSDCPGPPLSLTEEVCAKLVKALVFQRARFIWHLADIDYAVEYLAIWRQSSEIDIC